MVSPPQDWGSFDWDSLDWDSFTGYDDLILVSSIFFTLTEVPVEAKLKLPPLFAPTGKHLLKHLVVDLWGPEDDDPPCIGPWKWFKFTIDPMEGNAYVRLIYLSMEPNDNPYYYDSSSVATLATGTPFASSTDTDAWGSYPPDGVFDVESGVPWVSESGDPSPWIAFRFNDPTEFSYLYIMTFIGGFEGELPMTGGDVYVSNDSTDGIDGTWRLLRSGILDQSGIDDEVFLEVSLCTGDPVEVFYTPS